MTLRPGRLFVISIFILTGTFFGVLDSIANAQTSPTTSGSGSRLTVPQLESAIRSRWLRAGIQFGHFSLFEARSSIQSTSGNERLMLQNFGDSKSLEYTNTLSDGTVTLAYSMGSFSARFQVEKPSPKRPSVDYFDSRTKPIELIINDGKTERVLRADTFWQLWCANRTTCEELLEPLVAGLCPGTNFRQMADEIEQALVDQLDVQQSSNVQRWEELIDQLADDHFHVREAADRELRRAGRDVLSFLVTIDQRNLQPEQQVRLHRILLSLRPATQEDAPDQAASTIFGCQDVWLGMLSRDSEAIRSAAARRLSEMLGNEIEFDPKADKATRAKQIEAIKASLR